ncbi:hypothetical protein BD769DRAFT_1347906 [Suillus cothurnatus]|nr:hypothetical protein BD769DRAFT_1347906 [Suillus cothurnatus]
MWDLEFLIQYQVFEAPVICFSPDLTHALHSTSSFIQDSKITVFSGLNDDGWVVGPQGRLLLWIPLNFHPMVYAPGNTLMISNNALQLDLSRVAHGTSWHKCQEQ